MSELTRHLVRGAVGFGALIGVISRGRLQRTCEDGACSLERAAPAQLDDLRHTTV